MYYKVTNEKEIHNGFQYKDGLNKLDIPFERNGTCVKGGLYFTDREHIYQFLGYGNGIREVTLPETAQMVKDSGTESVKYRADSIILGKKWNLADVETWKEFKLNDMDRAAQFGHLEIVKCLHEIGKNCSIDAMDFAAKNGHLDILKYLHEIEKDCTTNAMDHAAENGHLDILKYLHEIGKECTTDAMDRAAQFGHLEVLKYLHEIGKECTTNAMDYATLYGHLEVLKYLHEIGKNCTVFAMDWAASKGHLEIIKYLHEIGKNSTIDVMTTAASNGHLEIVKFLHEIGKGCTTNAMNSAAFYGHLEVLKFLQLSTQNQNKMNQTKNEINHIIQDIAILKTKLDKIKESLQNICNHNFKRIEYHPYENGYDEICNYCNKKWYK